MLRCAAAGNRGLFDLALPLLLRALVDATPDDVFAEYAAGRAQLWLAFDGGEVRAACVTQAAGFDLHFWLCGGDGCDWRALGNEIAAVAKAGGFKRMTIDGRPGWLRVLGFVRASDGVGERML